jgi:hypothetical protein
MTEWVDLQDTEVIAGYAIHMMTVMNENGVGQACFLQLFSAEQETVKNVLIDPTLAGQMGWNLTGVTSGFEPAAMGFDSHGDDGDDDFDYDDDDLEDDT